MINSKAPDKKKGMDEKKRRLICELHKGGYKWQQILDRVGVSRATILKVIKAEKLSRRRTKLTESLRKEILELVRKGDQSTAEIAKQFNICTTSVDRIRLRATESPVTEEQRKMILQLFHRGCSRADIMREVKVDGDAAYTVIRSALAAQRKLSVTQAQQEQILNCFEEGRTKEHILKKFGITETTLQRILQQNGKTFQERSRKIYEERQASVLKLRAQGLTMRAISRQLKITTGAIFNILQKNCDNAPIAADGLPLSRVNLEMESSTAAGEKVVQNSPSSPVNEKGGNNIAVGCRRSARVTALQQRNQGCKRKSVYQAQTSESEASDAETSEAKSDASDAVISEEETETSDAGTSEAETDTCDAEDSETKTSGVGTSGFESGRLDEGLVAQQPAVTEAASHGHASTDSRDEEAHPGSSMAQPKQHKLNEKNKQLICEMYKSGCTWRKIAERVDINSKTLHKFIKAAKLPKRRTELTELQKNEIRKLAREGTLSPEEIAKRFSISVETVGTYRRMIVTNAQKKNILLLHHRGYSITDIMKEVKLGEEVAAVISRSSVKRTKVSVSQKKKKDILNCFEEGRGGSYIQKKFKISERTLNWILLQNGKSLQERSQNSYLQRQADIQKLRAEGLTMRAIAKQLKLSVRTISKILRKNWDQEASAPDVLPLSRKSPAMDNNSDAEEGVVLTPGVDDDGGSKTDHRRRRSARLLAMQQRVPGSECEPCCNSDCGNTFESNPDESTSHVISGEPRVCTAAVDALPTTISIIQESTTTNTHSLQDGNASEVHELDWRSFNEGPIAQGAQPTAVIDGAGYYGVASTDFRVDGTLLLHDAEDGGVDRNSGESSQSEADGHNASEVSTYHELTRSSFDDVFIGTCNLADMAQTSGLSMERLRSMLESGPGSQEADAPTTSTFQPTMTAENQDGTASQCECVATVTHSGDSVTGCTQHGSPNLRSSVCSSETAGMPEPAEVNELRNKGSQNAAAAHSHYTADTTDPPQPLSRVNEAHHVTPSHQHNVADSGPPIAPIGNITTMYIEPRDSSPERQHNEPPIVPTSITPIALPDPAAQERGAVTDGNSSPFRELQSIVLKLREQACSYEAVRQQLKNCFLSAAISTGDAEMPGCSRKELPQVETDSHHFREASSHGEQQRDSCDDLLGQNVTHPMQARSRV
ncbi:uncharacterized protein LOC129591060 [Paramacrobiotus metropolitanus]|uniref:uncharacterized protein LOC129591060 n=1 Tax=Paramacrobiotus metropolitanus TaxID=2943436 RepID=UPI0024462338|nr:uncharacterized protein LOC129591060 [Paramacrobiotus metropolitanus]